ncbi:hypothetical protein ACOT81_43415 [Streptomyces sp. WI04-05B]|nr:MULTISPECIES: hypothetical protein [unclassified Streptomyces]MDX2543333.1 hypothetical protein [Streptomyces sp. WI04-05B]MDX2586735.1 hypothetical protein [Streptomyces sp. WI04-05A]
MDRVALSYGMTAYRVEKRRLYMGVRPHGVSIHWRATESLDTD